MDYENKPEIQDTSFDTYRCYYLIFSEYTKPIYKFNTSITMTNKVYNDISKTQKFKIYYYLKLI